MPSNDPPDDGHLYGAAPEDEMIRLEEAYRRLADATHGSESAEMQRLRAPRKPLAGTGFTAGDLP